MGLNVRQEKEVEKREFDKYSLRRLIEFVQNRTRPRHRLPPQRQSAISRLRRIQPAARANRYRQSELRTPARRLLLYLSPDLAMICQNKFSATGCGGEKIRIWFGEPIVLDEFYAKSDRLRTHKEIADHLMTKIADLGSKDSLEFG